MKTTDTFVIAFRDLKPGNHHFEFTAGDLFFERYPEGEIRSGTVLVKTGLLKEERMLDFHFSIAGRVKIPCDRCNEPFELEIGGTERLIVKLGDEFREESEEVQIIPDTENTFDLSTFIYEFIHLLLPMRRIHPETSDGSSACNPAIMKKLEDLNKRSGFDDRWETLKKLKSEI